MDESSHSGPETEQVVRQELAELTSGAGDPSRELAGLAVAVLRDGKVSFEATFGRAYIDPVAGRDRELTPTSLLRIASISKTLSAIVALQLVQEGCLGLDRDVSEYLGWSLRNPHYPDREITLRMLLSHSSSIRDAGESYIIRYPRALREAFDPADPDFAERFQLGGPGSDRGPGVFYEYSNLNYGVVATVFEVVTGKRFDHLMRDRIFEPLALAGGFNVAELSPAQRADLATLYRKRDHDGIWHPEGDWVPQVDDPQAGIPTNLPEGADYPPGTNGAQFSPQGGARMSLRGLEALAKLLMGEGTVAGIPMLSPASMEQLRTPAWRYDPELENMEGFDQTLFEYTPGLRVVTGTSAGDRLFEGDTRRWFGHFGEAYGLLAGVWVHPESGDGVIFALTGTAFDPHEGDSGQSLLLPIEASILRPLGHLLDPS